MNPFSEFFQNAPSKMMGYGARLLIAGVLLVFLGAGGGESPFAIKVILFASALLFGGLFLLFIGWFILERQYKARTLDE